MVLCLDELVDVPLQIGLHIGLIVVYPLSLGVGVELGVAPAVDRLPDVAGVLLFMLLAFGHLAIGEKFVEVRIRI